MTPARLVLRLASVVVALLLSAPAFADTFLKMSGDPGEPLTGGQSYFFTPSDGSFTVSHNFPNVATGRFTSATQNWTLEFAGPYQRTLTSGVYLGAVRYPFQSDNSAGLAVSGNGFGCNEIAGEFQIRQVTYGIWNSPAISL